MIIVEGTDLLGKTHLAKELVNRLNELGFGHVYQHLSKLPKCWDREPETAGRYLALMSKDIVWDRFHMSRQAYGEVCRNQRMLSDLEYREIDAAARLYCCYTIVVVANEEFIARQWEKSGREEMYDRDTIIRVNQQYRKFIAASPSTGQRYDWDLYIDATDAWPSEHAERIANEYVERRRVHDHIALC